MNTNYLKAFVFALFVIPAMVYTSGCKDEVPPPTEEKKDTEEVIIRANRFILGFDSFQMNIDANKTYGYWKESDSATLIFVVGNDVSGNNLGLGEIEIRIPGKGVGTWKQSNMDDVHLELGHTEPGRPQLTYAMDGNSNVILTITKYDDVGGNIEGTFSGVLKTGINSIQVKAGNFQVERLEDEL